MAPRHKAQADIPSNHLGTALLDLVKRPRTTLWAAWSWKAASISTFFRAGWLFVDNLKAGRHAAFHAMLIEAVFAIFATGLLGAVSQRLRDSRPLWATAIVVWLAMPGIVTVAQFALQRAAGTPHLGTSLTVSFGLSALASSYSWYAMKHGAMLGGDDSTTFAHDLRALPGITLDYVLAPCRAVRNRL